MQEEPAIRRNQSPFCMTSQIAEARKCLRRGLRCEPGRRARLGSPCCQCVLVIGAFQREARKRCRVASPHTHSILMRGWWHSLGWAVQPLDGSLSVLRCPERVLVVGGIPVFFLARALGYRLGVRCAQALGLNTKEFCSQDPCSFWLLCHLQVPGIPYGIEQDGTGLQFQPQAKHLPVSPSLLPENEHCHDCYQPILQTEQLSLREGGLIGLGFLKEETVWTQILTHPSLAPPHCPACSLQCNYKNTV